MLADWPVAAIDQNVSGRGNAIACTVESQVLSWLCGLFELPGSFACVLTIGVTAANILGRFFARHPELLQQVCSVLASRWLNVVVFRPKGDDAGVKATLRVISPP